MTEKENENEALRKVLIASNGADVPSIADLFCELTDRSKKKILELTNEKEKLKTMIEHVAKVRQKERNEVILKVREYGNLRQKVSNLTNENQKLTAEIDRMKEYNENVVLPGVSAFQETTNEKISDLEAEVERLKAKIKAYES